MKITPIIVALLTTFSALAQDNPCFTDQIYDQHIQENPEIERHVQQMDRILRHPAVEQRGGTYIIPIVFHVIHKGGDENISKEQIENSVWHLNQDFRALNAAELANVNPVFASIIADCNMEFRLAQKDPNGNCTDGITRHYSSRTFHGDEGVKQDFPGWDNERYMNVWVCETLANGSNGYAYLPDVTDWGPWHDGIMIRFIQVGSIGTGSPSSRRTLTHEAGHYFGLRHTFQDGCDVDNDGVDDTPPTAESNFGCPDGQNTCSLDNPDMIDHIQNHMEYSSCRYMYTNGQRDRMHGAIAQYRSMLVSAGNHVFTGILQDPPDECQPTAEFQSNIIMLCEGEDAQFFDDSYNGDPTAWSWSFPGGTPATSDQQDPSTTYNTAGVYDVTLTASNSNGSSSFTENNLVIVSPSQGQTALPFAEGFETTAEFNEFIIDNPDGGNIMWDLTSVASASGARSIMLENIENDMPSVIDAFITPAYDLTTMVDPNLTFEVAFAETDEDENNDRLRVYISGDCGETWSLRFNRSGAQIATGPTSNNDFEPSSTQWELHDVSLSSAQQAFTNARFKFEFTAGGGNNIYIDDINISGEVGVNDLRAELNAVLFPNPSTGTATLRMDLNEPELVEVTILDVTGRSLSQSSVKTGSGQFNLNLDEIEHAGVYQVRVSTSKGNMSLPLIIQTK